MEFKAKVTHVVLDKDGRPYNARTVRAGVDTITSDVDISNGKPPFYYRVDADSTPPDDQSNSENIVQTQTASGSKTEPEVIE